MGFCSLNLVTCAAKHALLVPGNVVGKVAIFDWDVHHGNGVAALVDGTEEWQRAVAYCSVHELGNFPRTGDDPDTVGTGCGNLKHIPLPRGSGWAEYEKVLEEEVLPWLDGVSPDLLLVSAGYDALALDPYANMELDASDFGRMTARLMRWAAARGGKGGGQEDEGCCGGVPVALGLEGGYALDRQGLPDAIAHTVKALFSPSCSL